MRSLCRGFLNHTVTALVVALVVSATAQATTWPHARGPATDGSLRTSVFEPASTGRAMDLDLDWRVDIGPGYSGIVVEGSRVVTMFSEGDGDWVAAFDVDTGKRLWRHRLGARYIGEDGSTDGPLSSPLIHTGKVYAFAPRGRLFALDLENGAVAWSRAIAEELEAPKPTFGFTSTPLAYLDLVILQLGGEKGRSIVGLDAASGETRFSYGDKAVDYQSPALLHLAGRRQLVAASGDALIGLDPKSGTLLWRLPVENGTSNSAVPIAIGDNAFLVRAGGGVAAYRINREGDGFAVSELYTSNTLGRSYAPPVYHDGHVYGFRGQILTCMNAADGSRVWRSRPPGGEGLILVDGHLVVFGSGGNVVVAEASPKGYREVARHQALEGSALSWPSFADNRIFVRNLDQLAAVQVAYTARETTQTASVTPDVLMPKGEHKVGRLLATIEAKAKSERTAAVDAFVAEHPSWPIVDGEHVTFLFRGEANDVGIAGSMLDSGQIVPLDRVADTDLFHRTFRLEPGHRWEYRFQVDFETWHTDPRNPRTVPPIFGQDPFSEVFDKGYPMPDHLGAEAEREGRIETHALESEALESTKEVVVYLPSGFDESRTYPLLVVNEGPDWRDKGLLTRSLDHLIGTRVAPVIAAFVEPSRAWWEESGGSKANEYLAMLADELVPMLEKHYPLKTSADDRGMLGTRWYGATAMQAVLERPGVFGRAAMLSPNLEHGVRATLFEHIAAGKAKDATLYLDWSRFDDRRRDRGYSFAEEAEALAANLRAGGYAFVGGEVADSTGWGGMRARADRFLEALFPMP